VNSPWVPGKAFTCEGHRHAIARREFMIHIGV
jgi:hypothetical protein